MALSCQDYITHVVERVKTLTRREVLKSFDSVTNDNWHPELDETPLLDNEGKNLYQRLVGIGIWIICIGRFDIHFAINQLAR